MNSDEVLSLLAFTWNAHHINFCGNILNSNCSLPDFWNVILERIRIDNPVLIALAFQEGPHIDMDENMREIGYFLIGSDIAGGCSLFIYSRIPFGFEVIDIIHSLKSGSGVTLILKLPNNQKWGITNICLQKVSSLETMLRDVVYTPPMDYSTILGSFPVKPSSCPLDELLIEPNLCARLKDPFTSNLPDLLLEEGPNNLGPTFAPSCYLSTNRQPNKEHLLRLIGSGDPLPAIHQPSINDFNGKKAAWCDRIFYSTFRQNSSVRLTCLEYGRIDDPETSLHLSDHAIVYGYFTFILS